MFISFVRTLILYGVIVATVRLMGKRQMGELEPTELVAAILISDLAAVPMQDIGIPLLSGVVPILTLLALELLSAELSLRSIRFRNLLCGRPVFLIRDGAIDQKALAKTRLSLDELQESLREAGIARIDQVQYAILETSGKLSAFLYPAYAPLTAGAAGQPGEDFSLPLPVISDGRVLSGHLRTLGLSRAWVDRQLYLRGLRLREVFLMTATDQGQVYLVKKEEIP